MLFGKIIAEKCAIFALHDATFLLQFARILNLAVTLNRKVVASSTCYPVSIASPNALLTSVVLSS